MIKARFFFFVFGVLGFVVINAQSNLNDDFLSIKNRLKFANSLYENKDYLRAIDEYKYVLQSYNSDTVRFKLANSFFKLGKYEEASQNFKTLFVGSDLVEEAKFSYYKSEFFNKDFALYRNIFSNKIYYPEKYSNEISRLNSITYFLDKMPLPNQTELLSPFEDSVQTKLYYFYQMKKNPPKKSPTTAALLSAALPGAGKIYTGNITDGLIAFGATILCGFIAADNFNHDHNFRGWLFTGLTAFFYGGSIYGAAAAATIYNAKAHFDLENDIKNYFEKNNYFLPANNF